MRMILAAVAVAGLAAFAASGAPVNAAATAEGMEAAPLAQAQTEIRTAHGLHWTCKAGRRGWVHRHAVLTLGLPTVIGCL